MFIWHLLPHLLYFHILSVFIWRFLIKKTPWLYFGKYTRNCNQCNLLLTFLKEKIGVNRPVCPFFFNGNKYFQTLEQIPYFCESKFKLIKIIQINIGDLHEIWGWFRLLLIIFFLASGSRFRIKRLRRLSMSQNNILKL